MIRIVPFNADSILQPDNGVVIRNNFEDIEFGFPYFDALPVKLSVRQCMDLIQFIKAVVNHLDDGGAISIRLRPIDHNVDQVIAVRKVFDAVYIHFAFTDVKPVNINLQELVHFSEILKEMLAIKLIDAPREVR